VWSLQSPFRIYLTPFRWGQTIRPDPDTDSTLVHWGGWGNHECVRPGSNSLEVTSKPFFHPRCPCDHAFHGYMHMIARAIFPRNTGGITPPPRPSSVPCPFVLSIPKHYLPPSHGDEYHAHDITEKPARMSKASAHKLYFPPQHSAPPMGIVQYYNTTAGVYTNTGEIYSLGRSHQGKPPKNLDGKAVGGKALYYPGVISPQKIQASFSTQYCIALRRAPPATSNPHHRVISPLAYITYPLRKQGRHTPSWS